jgi:hypothetical protein
LEEEEEEEEEEDNWYSLDQVPTTSHLVKTEYAQIKDCLSENKTVECCFYGLGLVKTPKNKIGYGI